MTYNVCVWGAGREWEGTMQQGGELHISLFCHGWTPMDIHSLRAQFQCMPLSHPLPFPSHGAFCSCVLVIFKHMMGVLPRSL